MDYNDLSSTEKLEIVESIIVDVLEERNRYHIKSWARLSDQRCEEIEQNVGQIIKSYDKRHGINQ